MCVGIMSLLHDEGEVMTSKTWKNDSTSFTG